MRSDDGRLVANRTPGVNMDGTPDRRCGPRSSPREVYAAPAQSHPVPWAAPYAAPHAVPHASPPWAAPDDSAQREAARRASGRASEAAAAATSAAAARDRRRTENRTPGVNMDGTPDRRSAPRSVLRPPPPTAAEVAAGDPEMEAAIAASLETAEAAASRSRSRSSGSSDGGGGGGGGGRDAGDRHCTASTASGARCRNFVEGGRRDYCAVHGAANDGRPKWPRGFQEEVFEACEGHCFYCGKQLAFGNRQTGRGAWQMEHLMHHARTADDSFDNVVAACVACNAGRNAWEMSKADGPGEQVTARRFQLEVLERPARCEAVTEAGGRCKNSIAHGCYRFCAAHALGAGR